MELTRDICLTAKWNAIPILGFYDDIRFQIYRYCPNNSWSNIWTYCSIVDSNLKFKEGRWNLALSSLTYLLCVKMSSRQIFLWAKSILLMTPIKTTRRWTLFKSRINFRIWHTKCEKAWLIGLILRLKKKVREAKNQRNMFFQIGHPIITLIVRPTNIIRKLFQEERKKYYSLGKM